MNRSLVKRLKIAHTNKQDYKTEIQKCIMMYNVKPHGTTGTPPSELMFNRVIRDKIPGIQDITDNILDSGARDLDIVNKQKTKEKSDSRRRAKDSDIAPGDNVLLRNVVFPHKLTPTFDVTEYEILERNGNEVVVAGGGRTFRRNISHVKKVPTTEAVEPERSSPPSSATNSQDTIPAAPSSGLRLRLKNIGGMWRSETEHTQHGEHNESRADAKGEE